MPSAPCAQVSNFLGASEPAGDEFISHIVDKLVEQKVLLDVVSIDIPNNGSDPTATETKNINSDTLAQVHETHSMCKLHIHARKDIGQHSCLYMPAAEDGRGWRMPNNATHAEDSKPLCTRRCCSKCGTIFASCRILWSCARFSGDLGFISCVLP